MARGTYWMHAVFPNDLNSRVGDESKTDNIHINIATKFLSLQRKYD